MLMHDAVTAQQEVIHHIALLLPTIEDALLHMQQQLTELRMEESLALFQDTASALAGIANAMLPLIEKGEDKELLQAMVVLREGVSLMVDAYETKRLFLLEQTLVKRLIPAFYRWRDILEVRVKPSVVS